MLIEKRRLQNGTWQSAKKHGHKGSEKLLDTSIGLTQNYLSQSVNVLFEFSILLVFTLWRKQFAEEEAKAFASVNAIVFKLISNHRFKVSIRILEYVLGLKNTKVTEGIRRMMIVNLASTYKHAKEPNRCIEVLEAIDWSASADNYKICVAALKEETTEVVRLMSLVTNSGAIGKNDLKDWPVFSFMRDDDDFCSKFLEVFGESIRDEKRQQPIKSSGENVTIARETSDSSTVH